MTNTMYHIVFIAGLASTSAQATAELERAAAASGMMRRETKQEVEVTAHAFAKSTNPKAHGHEQHEDGNKKFVRKAGGDVNEKAPIKHESEEAGKSAAHHKTHHHHGHGHHRHHRKHEHSAKVKELDDAGAHDSAKEKVQKKQGKHSKDDIHSKDDKLDKKSTAAHVKSKHDGKQAHQTDGAHKLGGHKLEKNENRGQDEKHEIQKTTTHGDAKALSKERAHTLAKNTKHANAEKQHDKKAAAHDEKHAAQKTATHADTKHIAKELSKESARTLDKHAKHGQIEKQHDKETVAHGNTEKLAKGEKRVSSLRAAEDAGHIRDLGDLKKDETSALEEIAKEVESLHLTESELDPDENYHAHKQEAFQVKVTGPEGNEMCLSEVHHGYQVRAVKCSSAHGQHWYWDERQLKTLKSKQRCLGYIFGKHEHRLAMYPCADGLESSYTAWKMDDTGRLRSLDTDRCMAFDAAEDKKLNAITQLCDEP